jgi:hypothetical protein
MLCSLCLTPLLLFPELKRLVIDGPGDKLGTCTGDRDDKLSNLFGYSTLAAMSPQLEFFQVRTAVAEVNKYEILQI